MTRYFEDMEVGLTGGCGSLSVTESEIVEFGERYDPQPFHTDPEAAGESMYGGLIASGWQTCALTARLLVKNYLNDVASGGGRSGRVTPSRFGRRWLRNDPPGTPPSARPTSR